MAQEDRKLLLIDICGRLPYDVQGEGEYEEEPDYEHPFGSRAKSIGHIDGIDHIGFDDGEIYVTIEGIPCELSTVKLYLRPMESMTEEEIDYVERHFYYTGHNDWDYVDWLNANGFDYRGLIEKDLAIKKI